MPAQAVSQALWRPGADRIQQARITGFARRHAGIDLAEHPADAYRRLHAWSVGERGAFWAAVWDAAGLVGQRGDRTTTQPDDAMPGTRFFPDACLNFAENLLAPGAADDIAIIAAAEDGTQHSLSRDALRAEVDRIAGWLAAQGVTAGDRVAAVLPNVPETVIAALAAAKLGAVWSSCSPDFGVAGILDRFTQIEPKVLIGVGGYRYGGKLFDVRDKLAEVRAALPGVQAAALVPGAIDDGMEGWSAWADCGGAATDFAQLPFDHPLYILFSSGTTGRPKCIVHGAGGTLLQHAKEHRLHCDIRPGDRVCYFTTCGWMMWNWLVSALQAGASLVLYDGNPAWPSRTALFDLVDAVGLSFLGVSAGLINALRQAGDSPASTHRLDTLRSVASTGSPLSHEAFAYVYSDIKADVHLASISGGTDIVSCFVVGNPTLPVYAGQIQCAGLGMAVDVWAEDGTPARVGDKGELVCTAPFPSMPVGFWNDPDGERYRGAYFEHFDKVWHHGDFAEKTPEGGIIIHGRSDATLNPGGVRIGTAEIYRVVERVDGVADAAVVGVQADDDVQVVLLVVAPDGLDEALEQTLRRRIRAEASPRHVPAHIVAIPAVPKTRTGKIPELALKAWLEGRAVKNRNALVDADVLDTPPPPLA